jgi:GTPase SAR1 family protein
MLGEKVNTENGLDFYVFPQEELTDAEEQRSINIMVIGETGVGKSTWLHCFLNYLQGIQIEEKNRYYLFDEKKLQEKYNLDHPYEQKTSGSSVTDKPTI